MAEGVGFEPTGGVDRYTPLSRRKKVGPTPSLQPTKSTVSRHSDSTDRRIPVGRASSIPVRIPVMVLTGLPYSKTSELPSKGPWSICRPSVLYTVHSEQRGIES